MTMGPTATQKILLAVLALLACAGLSAPDALGATGGALAGTAPAAKTPTTRSAVHPSGIATWFGPGFYGKQTACGQTLTPNIVGVANRTLPCGTLVKVSYRGRRLTVPVIDRGPYGPNGADWDLTSEAARALGVQDTVRISARVVGKVPNSPLLGLPPVSPLAAATGGAAVG